MSFQYRVAGTFLAGTCLMGSVAHAQFGADCVTQPDCAVAAPTCAVGELSCDTVCAPLRPPIRYQVPKTVPRPRAPITYEVVGRDCAPMGCAPLDCAPTDCVSIPCEGLPYASVGCAEIGCDNSSCPGGGSCLTGRGGCLGDGCLGGGSLGGGAGVGGVAASAITLVGATAKEKYRSLSRSWYYKSFDRHRHLHHPIVSPAGHPTHGYYQTCWERFPEEGLWCPPCYGNAAAAADMYNAPAAYPTTMPPGTGMIVPPAAPPAAAAPTSPPTTSPAAPEEYSPPIQEETAPDSTSAPAVSPTASASMLYAP